VPHAQRRGFLTDAVHPVPRATVLAVIRQTMAASVDKPSEVEAAEAWLNANRDALTYVEQEGGCGCCIRMWKLEGPAEVLATIPYEVSASSDWDTA
jgi:hypothetical protein